LFSGGSASGGAPSGSLSFIPTNAIMAASISLYRADCFSSKLERHEL
jgi:hypothetical protein